MSRMSNNQWNNGQADGQWQPQGNQDWNSGEQPQGSATDWNAAQDQTADWNPGAQPQGSAQEWNPAASQQDWNTGAQQPPAQEWNAQPQGGTDWNAQPQTSAQDWNQQQPAQDWNAQPQGSADWNQQQPQGGADWNQQPPAQDWNAQQQQGWNQQGGFQGAPAYGGQPGQQQWPAQRTGGGNAFANVFDFSFKKFALPKAGGTIFLVAVVCFAVWWVFDLVSVLTMGAEYGGVSTSTVLQVVVGGLARTFLGILLVRVLIEGASAVVKLADRADDDKDPSGV